MLKAGKALYHIDRKIAEIDNAPFGDESHIIYVNGAYKSFSENDPYIQVSNLVHDMKCKEASQMHISQLAKTFKFFKGTAEGVKTMSDVMKELVAEGEKKEKRKTIRRMLIMNKFSYDEIAECVDTSVEFVEEVADEMMQLC